MVGLTEALPDCDLTVVGAEFGTHDPLRVFQAMRADNWLHQHGELESAQGIAIKKELLEVFRPEDPKSILVSAACRSTGSSKRQKTKGFARCFTESDFWAAAVDFQQV